MKIIDLLFPFLIGLSSVSTLVAFIFLQSRAKGISRLLLYCGVMFFVIPPLCISFINIENRHAIHGIIAAGSTNIGAIILSLGVVLFSISLPSKRIEMKPQNKKPISDQILKDMYEREK